MKRLKALMIISAALLAFGIAAFAHEGHKAEHKHPYPTAPFDLAKGEALYNQYCASCHGLKGDGKGPAAAALNPKPTDFLDMAYMTMRSRADHYDSIVKGRPATAMPPWKNVLSEKDVWNIIAYLEHLFNHQAEKAHSNHERGGH